MHTLWPSRQSSEGDCADLSVQPRPLPLARSESAACEGSLRMVHERGFPMNKHINFCK